MIREERTPLAELTEDQLESLYRRLEGHQNAPILHTCLIPGCLRQYDSLAAMDGRTPELESWSSKGWHTLGSGSIFPAGGHICPDHIDLVTAHHPIRLELPNGRWSINCPCGWTPVPQRWHGVLAAMWEQHILTVTGRLAEAPPPTDPEHRLPLAQHTPDSLAELYDRLWDAEYDSKESREFGRAVYLAYCARDQFVDQAYAAIAALRRTMAMDPRDWSQDKRDAYLWALLVGWGCQEQHEHDDICSGDAALLEVAAKHQWTNDMQRRIRIFRTALAAIGPNDQSDIEDARACLRDPDMNPEA